MRTREDASEKRWLELAPGLEADVQRAVGLDKPAELKGAQSVRAALEAKLKDARRDVENLTLRAKTGGTVLTPHLEMRIGRRR